MGVPPVDVSIVVPARDASRLIADCVHALLSQEECPFSFEVLVVDDGSSDDTAAVARQAGARVLSISPSGPAAARNRGVAVTTGDIVVFTDADCVPDPGWLSRMVAPFADSEVTATKGVYRTEQRSLAARFVQQEYESRYRRMSGRESIDFIDTYAAAFRRDRFVEAGGFDENFPGASVEDQEFSFRYSRLGGHMLFVEDAVVLHRHADTPWKYFRKKLKIAYWKVRVLKRHPDKIISDAHTPPNVKVEMLTALTLLLTAPFLDFPVGLAVFASLLVVFASSCGPLVWTMARSDAMLGLVAPGFCLMRAWALGVGCVAGVVSARGQTQSAARPTTSFPEHTLRIEREHTPENVKEEVHDVV